MADGSGLAEVYPINCVPANAISENGRYEFLVRLNRADVPIDWTVVIGPFRVDRVVRGDATVFACEIGFFPGTLAFKVLSRTRVEAVATVAVSPKQVKITTDHYSVMLDDLRRWTLALYRFAGATIPVGAKAGGIENDLVALSLVGGYIDSLEAAVHRIADRPVIRFVQTEQILPVARVRSISNRSLLRAVRSPLLRPATAVERAAAPEFVAALGGHSIERLSEQKKSRHSDNYEHRALLGFLIWLDQTLNRIALAVEAQGREGKLFQAKIAAADIRIWRDKIEAMRRRDIFRDIAPDAHLRPSNIFMMKPEYKAAYTTAMRLRSGIGPEVFSLNLPIAQTPAIYEMWCLMGVALAVAEEFPASRVSIEQALQGVPAEGGLGWGLSQGTDWTIQLPGKVVMNYQLPITPTAGAYGLRTTVVGAVPDITFTRLDDAGAAELMVILDPKYRAGSSLADGLRSLHFYRDAIANVPGRRLVGGAAALHPDEAFKAGSSHFSADAPTAILAKPGAGIETFRETVRAVLRVLH